jgi:uncharacterized protein involved in exopolysaccharide biosynthesis
MKVTERLASLFIEDNSKDRAFTAEGASAFLARQLEVLRGRLDAQEATIAVRARSGSRLTKGESIEYEVLKQQYRDLLTKRQSALTVVNLEKQQIGEQFELLDAARIPEKPIAPNRVAAHAGGAAIGLALGIALIGFRLRRRQGVDPPAPAPDNASATP